MRASTSPASGSGVIGTGSSGIQSIPVIAEQADSSSCSSARPYSVPAHNHPIDERSKQAVKADYAALPPREQPDAVRARLPSAAQ